MNFKTFDLNLLRVLDALLETGSTTDAARRVGLSQPAVSAALGRLRTALGDPLFLREGRSLTATDFARDLRDPLRRLLGDTEKLLSGAAPFDPLRASGTFKVSGSDFFAEMLMPRLAGRLTRKAPNLRVQLVDLVPDSHIDSLERYGVDMALIPQTDTPDWIDALPLFTSRFVAIARRGHPTLQQAGITPGDEIPIDLFCSLQHVLFSPEGNTTGMGDAALARVGQSRNVAMTMPVFSGVYNAVAQSDMIALLPAQLARRMAGRVGFDLYQPPMPVPAAVITMIWHRRATNNPAHRWLREQIATLLAPLDEKDI